MTRVIICAWFVAGILGCRGEPVGRPEVAGLIPDLQGEPLLRVAGGGVSSWTLPGLSKYEVRVRCRESGITGMAGPDDKHRMTFFWYNAGKAIWEPDTYEIRVLDLKSKKERIVKQFRGSYKELSLNYPNIALAHASGVLAFLKRRDKIAFGPEYNSRDVELCELLIVDIEDANLAKIADNVLDKGIAWLDKGRHLLFVRQLSRIEAMAQAEDSEVEKFIGWEGIPGVFLVDVKTLEERFVHLGWYPYASEDYILLRDPGDWKIVRRRTNEVVQSITIPKYYPGYLGSSIIGLLDKDYILYRGLSEDGDDASIFGLKPKYKPQTVRVYNWRQDICRVLITGVHPFDGISYGVPAEM
jgi:hypothetical protein